MTSQLNPVRLVTILPDIHLVRYEESKSDHIRAAGVVISGVVFVTTGDLFVTGLFLEVYVVVEQGDVVLTQQIEKLASGQA